MNTIEKLKDLHKQATTEHSHFYVASVCEEAIAELERLSLRELNASAPVMDIAFTNLERIITQRAQLRKALVALVGVDDKKELEGMADVLRLAPIPDADKAATLNAIRALLETLSL